MNPLQARTGKVFLIGAGPGDPELLTLKAARLIAEADVILVDDLVNREVLAHARPAARLRFVGKRGGCRSTPQTFINRLMAHEAGKGHQVVRLKGGDALIFGRANEEIDYLQVRGIDVELVAGISSAQAAGMALGRSLTDRSHSHGLLFVTGHPMAHGEALEYAALARQGLTLVFYMGLARCELIRKALLAGGLQENLPAAIVERASCPGERVLRTTLGGLSECVLRYEVQSPALLMVGQVAALQAAGSEFSAAIAGLRPEAESPSGRRARSG